MQLIWYKFQTKLVSLANELNQVNTRNSRIQPDTPSASSVICDLLNILYHVETYSWNAS